MASAPEVEGVESHEAHDDNDTPKMRRAAQRRASTTSMVGGVLFLLLLTAFAWTLHMIYDQFEPAPLHLLDVRFASAENGQKPNPGQSSVPGAPWSSAADESVKIARDAGNRTQKDVSAYDASALKLHYFAVFAHRELLGFWFNLFAGSLLILFGMFVFFEAVINGEPEGDNAFEFKTGGGLQVTLRSRSLGMVAVTSGAAVLLLVKEANRPTTEIVDAFFKDVNTQMGSLTTTPETPRGLGSSGASTPAGTPTASTPGDDSTPSSLEAQIGQRMAELGSSNPPRGQ